MAKSVQCTHLWSESWMQLYTSSPYIYTVHVLNDTYRHTALWARPRVPFSPTANCWANTPWACPHASSKHRNSRLCVKNETTESRRVSLWSPSQRLFQERLPRNAEWSQLAFSFLLNRQRRWSQSKGVTHTSTERACLLPSLDVTLPPGLVMVLGQLIRKPGGELMHG